MGPPPPPPPARAKPGFSARQKALAGLALAAMAIGGGAVGATVATAFQEPQVVTASNPSPTFKQASNPLSVPDVAAKVQPSVVMIKGATGEGSGVVLSEDGLILTNNHVVVGAGQGGGGMSVKFNDGRTAKASVVGTDPATDLAVIRAEDVSGLTAAALGDSDALKVGDSVLALGSPLGLSGSVTMGIVSALDRTLTVGGEQQQAPPGWGQGGGAGRGHHDRRRHPDGRGDQPRQLGRRAGERRRAAGRHQHRHRHGRKRQRQHRRRLRHPDQHRQAGVRPAHQQRQGQPRVPRRERHRRHRRRGRRAGPRGDPRKPGGEGRTEAGRPDHAGRWQGGRGWRYRCWAGQRFQTGPTGSDLLYEGR